MKRYNIQQLYKNSYIKYGTILLLGILVGWLIFGRSGNSTEQKEPHQHGIQDKQVWTCSMHPQIRQDKPGKCPICAMDLIPLKTAYSGSDTTIDPNGIQISEEAIALANIQTTVIGSGNPQKSVQLYGTIQADERLSQTQPAHVPGRIEKLLVNFVGESVRQGQTIATLYSPELLNAQQELLEAAKLATSQPYLLQAAREKLRYWNLSDDQIGRIEKSGKVSPIVDVKSNTNGILVEKNVNQGDYVNQGTIMFKVANLSQVWALFDAYEGDLPFLMVGSQLSFTLKSLPGKIFSGKISFIDPIVDKNTRTAKVRVVIPNPGLVLKPEMYATATVNASLKQYEAKIIVPKSAILWTGKRSIVYVKQQGVSSPVFSLREIELGPSLGEAFVVLSGLSEGDEIVTNGVFTIDASAQLEGKQSMMNHPSAASSHGDGPSESKGAQIRVQGICEMCKENIETAAKGVKGVAFAQWDKNKKILQLRYNTSMASLDNIGHAIAEAGYDNETRKAPLAAYEALAPCCKYRK